MNHADDPTDGPSPPAAVAEAQAHQDLFRQLYDELHRMARRELWKNGGGSTLSATTLLHEAYLDFSRSTGKAFPDKARFMAYASRVMRGLIIDHARRRSAQKRGGLLEFTELNTAVADSVQEADRLQVVSDALDQLETIDPELASLVDLKYFCGLNFAEIAALRGVSERTVQRGWEKARLALHHLLEGEDLA